MRRAVKGSLTLTGPGTADVELAVGLLLRAGAGGVCWTRYRPRHARI
jgi:hypothetical protein